VVDRVGHLAARNTSRSETLRIAWSAAARLPGCRVSPALADSDIVHESICEFVVPSADLLTNDPADLRLNAWARPRFPCGSVRLRQRCGNVPDQFAYCLRTAAQ